MHCLQFRVLFFLVTLIFILLIQVPIKSTIGRGKGIQDMLSEMQEMKNKEREKSVDECT